MNWIRKVLVLLLGIAGIVGIGIAYERLVKPQELVWDEDNPVLWDRSQMPLKVGGAYPDALRAAVELWNSQADCWLFTIDHENPAITVEQLTVKVGEEAEDWAAGAFVNQSRTGGKILVYEPLMVGTDLVVLHHELGHILGLGHDRAFTMKPTVKEDLQGSQPMVRASDKDIEALNERYCRK